MKWYSSHCLTVLKKEKCPFSSTVCVCWFDFSLCSLISAKHLLCCSYLDKDVFFLSLSSLYFLPSSLFYYSSMPGFKEKIKLFTFCLKYDIVLSLLIHSFLVMFLSCPLFTSLFICYSSKVLVLFFFFCINSTCCGSFSENLLLSFPFPYLRNLNGHLWVWYSAVFHCTPWVSYIKWRLGPEIALSVGLCCCFLQLLSFLLFFF